MASQEEVEAELIDLAHLIQSNLNIEDLIEEAGELCCDAFYIEIFQTLFNFDELQGIDPDAETPEAQAKNIQILIDLLQHNIQGMDLSGLSGLEVANGNPEHIYQFLTLLASVIDLCLEEGSSDDDHQEEETESRKHSPDKKLVEESHDKKNETENVVENINRAVDGEEEKGDSHHDEQHQLPDEDYHEEQKELSHDRRRIGESYDEHEVYEEYGLEETKSSKQANDSHHQQHKNEASASSLHSFKGEEAEEYYSSSHHPEGDSCMQEIADILTKDGKPIESPDKLSKSAKKSQQSGNSELEHSQDESIVSRISEVSKSKESSFAHDHHQQHHHHENRGAGKKNGPEVTAMESLSRQIKGLSEDLNQAQASASQDIQKNRFGSDSKDIFGSSNETTSPLRGLDVSKPESHSNQGQVSRNREVEQSSHTDKFRDDGYSREISSLSHQHPHHELLQEDFGAGGLYMDPTAHVQREFVQGAKRRPKSAQASVKKSKKGINKENHFTSHSSSSSSTRKLVKGAGKKKKKKTLKKSKSSLSSRPSSSQSGRDRILEQMMQAGMHPKNEQEYLAYRRYLADQLQQPHEYDEDEEEHVHPDDLIREGHFGEPIDERDEYYDRHERDSAHTFSYNDLYTILADNINQRKDTFAKLGEVNLPFDDAETQDKLLQHREQYKNVLREHIRDQRKNEQLKLRSLKKQKNYTKRDRKMLEIRAHRFEEELHRQEMAKNVRRNEKQLQVCKRIIEMATDLEKHRIIEDRNRFLEERKKNNQSKRIALQRIENLYRDKVEMLKEKKQEARLTRKLISQAQREALSRMERETKLVRKREMEDIKNRLRQEEERFEVTNLNVEKIEQELIRIYKRS